MVEETKHSELFGIIKSLYDSGIKNITFYLNAGAITKEEYIEITGESKLEKYYLMLISNLYISVSESGEIILALKDASNIQQTFNQKEIDTLQDNPNIKDKINLDACKVLVVD